MSVVAGPEALYTCVRQWDAVHTVCACTCVRTCVRQHTVRAVYMSTYMCMAVGFGTHRTRYIDMYVHGHYSGIRAAYMSTYICTRNNFPAFQTLAFWNELPGRKNFQPNDFQPK
jgi:hypothetical protein